MEILVFCVIIFLVLRFVVQSYQVQGPAMQPGLQKNDNVMVNKTSYLFHKPERGDIIVFQYPYADRSGNYVLRIVGLPGDTIKTDLTHVWVNNVQLNEPYISKPANIAGQQWTVPPNQYFVLSDNRVVSDDSRTWGFVPKEFIIGKAVLVYWPLNRFVFINSYPDVFRLIPAMPAKGA